MNFYDKVHDMIKCLKETVEYTEYIKVKNEVKVNKELEQKIIEFRNFQKSEQMKYLKGEVPNDENKAKLSQMYAEIVNTDLGLRYFQAEIRIDVMLADMQKIISDGIGEVVEF